MQLVFPGGQRVIYKPKGLGLEAAYNRLVAWLAEQGAPVRLRAIQVVDRAAYGWAQFVEPAGCASRLDVAGYYRRAGALLCLVHLLEGTDCHLENIVAAGVDPVLVDAETLLHHRVGRAPSSRDDDPDLLASEEYWASVYRTGMLPSWVLDREGKPVDTSGLGGFGEQATLRRLLRWDYVNTDEMQLRAAPGHLTREANVPTLDGVAQIASGPRGGAGLRLLGHARVLAAAQGSADLRRRAPSPASGVRRAASSPGTARTTASCCTG